MQKTKTNTLVWLTESAIMIALATVLSLITLVDLPYGGSVTPGSMLPMILIAYRYGIGRGCITGLANGVIQLFLGMGTLQYATSWIAAIVIILLDYIIAFGVTGFSAMFKGVFKESQSAALITGGFVVCVLRYICHVISGCTVWAGVSIPSSDGLLYSIIYNATYMLPETIIVVALLWYVSRVVNFNGELPRPAVKTGKAGKARTILSAIAMLCLLGAIIYDTVAIFGVLQNPETGEFNFAAITTANWPVIGIVTGFAVVIAAVLLIISTVSANRSNANSSKI